MEASNVMFITKHGKFDVKKRLKSLPKYYPPPKKKGIKLGIWKFELKTAQAVPGY